MIKLKKSLHFFYKILNLNIKIVMCTLYIIRDVYSYYSN